MRTTLLCTALTLMLASSALAADVFRLDFRYETDIPAFPTTIEVNVYKGDSNGPNPSDFRGGCTADFDGTTLSNINCGDYVMITGATVMGGKLLVFFAVNGNKTDGTFESSSDFEVIVGGVQGWVNLHTSCSRIIWIERRYGGTVGDFYVEDADSDGDCIIPEGECPTGNKLYVLRGEICVPCTAPGDVTFNYYKGDNDLRGTATATFDGATLTNVDCDAKVCLTGVTVNANGICVFFEAFGQKDNDEFETETSFELIVDGCGTFFYENLHTSCSRTIFLNQPYPMTPGGEMILRSGCGACLEGIVPVESGTWGQIKATYR